MSIQIGIGLSTDNDPRLAAKEAIRQAKTQLQSENISLAFLFTSITLAYPGLLKTVGIALGNIPLIGCTSAAILSHQGIQKNGLAVMLISLPKSIHFSTACVDKIQAKGAFGAGLELADNLLFGSSHIRRDLSIIFSDGLIPEGSNLIYGLQEKLGRSFPLAGASASDNLRFLKTYVYFNEGISNDSACGILWSGKLNFGLGTKHGWKPLGKPRQITKSSGNIIYEIDGISATTVYEEYFACGLSELKKKLKYISTLYPIGIYLPAEDSYLLRNILSFENNGSIILQGEAPQNSQIHLMIGTKESCLQATHEAAEEAKKSLSISILEPHKKNKVDFVLVFNSVSRYILLRRDAQKEINILQEVFGSQTPILGIYTYGEQAPLKAASYQGRAYFHNQSITVLAITGID